MGVKRAVDGISDGWVISEIGRKGKDESRGGKETEIALRFFKNRR